MFLGIALLICVFRFRSGIWGFVVDKLKIRAQAKERIS